jgi:hypothetical protein
MKNYWYAFRISSEKFHQKKEKKNISFKKEKYKLNRMMIEVHTEWVDDFHSFLLNG